MEEETEAKDDAKEEAMTKLRKKDVHFRWTEAAELFVVQQYAQYISPLEIVKNLCNAFHQHTVRDLDTHGTEAFYLYLRPKVYLLSPTNKQFPEKYEQPFDDFRKEYLKDVSGSYLAHRRNRLHELDNLYQELVQTIHASNEPKETRETIKSCLGVLKEARAEMDTNKITMEAEITGDNARVMATRQVDVGALSTEEIQELMRQHESSHTRTPAITNGDTARGTLSPATTGDGEAGGGGGSTPKETDKQVSE